MPSKIDDLSPKVTKTLSKLIMINKKTPEREKNVAVHLKKAVKAEKGFCIKLSASTIKGLPDYLVLLRGVAKFVEVKSQGKKPSKIQLLMHEQLAALGFQVWVIDSKKYIKAFINSFL